MSDNGNLLSEFVKREQELGLFNIKIDGVVVYGFLCRELRKKYHKHNRPAADKDKIEVRKKTNKKYTIISFLQLLKLFLFRGSIDNFIYSFYRVDQVDGLFMDKFTDPLIDLSSIQNNYIIFEKSINFEHKTPRIHSSKTVYTDYIEQRAIKFANRNKESYISKHKSELENLWGKLDKLMGDIPYSKDWTVTRLLRDTSMMIFYKRFFLRHHVKRFIAPSRAVFRPQMYVCKELDIPVLEMQHGVVDGNGGISYIGYDDNHFVPDYFLSFGDLYNLEGYGLKGSKAINIGWALAEYIKEKVTSKDILHNHVLVITSLKINSIFKLIGTISDIYPNIIFKMRLHPLAVLTEYANQIVKNHPNISIQDNSQNISVELPRYEMIIGDNSTVLVEALALGKKVGRISYEEIQPKYFCEEEKDVEWVISDFASFKTFLDAKPKGNNSLRFYSKYNREVLESLLR